MFRALITQLNVMHALVLRDIQTRFGGRHVNFLLALCWPMAHIAVLLIIYGVMGRAAPLGASATMFFATGLTPYMFFQYPARFTLMAVPTNRPLLAFPIVKLLDVILARAILETVAGCAVIVVTAFALTLIGEDVWPREPATALAALSAMWVMAMGFGLLSAVIATVFPAWMIISVVFTIALYITSGILFVPTSLPERLQEILAWNPVTQGVEWFRTAYYPEALSPYFPDKIYPFVVGVVLIFAALVSERFIVRKTV